jgi:hypothetical protein
VTQTRARLRRHLAPGQRVKYRGRGAVVLHLLAGRSSVCRVRFGDGREATVRRVRDVIVAVRRRDG